MTACRVLPVSAAEATVTSDGVPGAIVNSPSAGIRSEATKGIDSAPPLPWLCSPIFAAHFDSRFDLFGLVTNLNATYSYNSHDMLERIRIREHEPIYDPRPVCLFSLHMARTSVFLV